ncbi:MAG: Na+/H+ antiporter NhaA, partial [Ignavibacteria bacterium]|nr:Na+/H+ antiporter NhaA [Ignavibacteria bacterium]
IFALVNFTVILIDSAAIKKLSSSLSLGIILGLFIGKAAGIHAIFISYR